MPGSGIFLSDEGIIPNHPVGHDQKIYNNIIVDAGWGINFSCHNTNGAALINDVIANNTIVNEMTSYQTHGIHIGAPGGNANHQNTVIENNLVFTPFGYVGDVVGSTSGLSFINNLPKKKV